MSNRKRFAYNYLLSCMDIYVCVVYCVQQVENVEQVMIFVFSGSNCYDFSHNYFITFVQYEKGLVTCLYVQCGFSGCIGENHHKI